MAETRPPVEVRDEICRAGGIPILLDLVEGIPPDGAEKKDLNFLSEMLIICNRLTLLGTFVKRPLGSPLDTPSRTRARVWRGATERHRRKLRSDRVAKLFGRLSHASQPELRECAENVMNNLEIPGTIEASLSLRLGGDRALCLRILSCALVSVLL